MDGGELASGMYLIRVEGQGFVQTRKVIVSH
jgi:hypothetical protein